ncbi:hypothetical protein [Oerskovia flava]|uniref:hypothetical protein n=1 Tax=Oerskovia flava TaxID=2986422 RepID=UPI0022404A10|nr:hypothetical protein [Oerskovia sp. JB1-3-2]
MIDELNPGGAARRNVRIVALVLVCLFAYVGCTALQDSRHRAFQENDTYGYRACDHFERSDGAGGNVHRELTRAAAKLALDSNDRRIQEAVDDRNGGQDGAPLLLRAGKELRDACKSAGYDFGR